MKKFLSFILLLAIAAPVSMSGAQAEWVSLGTATVSEMFTDRDFDPSYDRFDEIILVDGIGAIAVYIYSLKKRP